MVVVGLAGVVEEGRVAGVARAVDDEFFNVVVLSRVPCDEIVQAVEQRFHVERPELVQGVGREEAGDAAGEEGVVVGEGRERVEMAGRGGGVEWRGWGEMRGGGCLRLSVGVGEVGEVGEWWELLTHRHEGVVERRP